MARYSLNERLEGYELWNTSDFHDGAQYSCDVFSGRDSWYEVDPQQLAKDPVGGETWRTTGSMSLLR